MKMLPMLLLTCLAALLFIYVFMPALWMSLMSADDSLDAHEAGLAVVASRHPFRENEVACMAKLLMLRHKVHQTNSRRRRGVSHTRQSARTFHVVPVRPKAPWIPFRKSYGIQHH